MSPAISARPRPWPLGSMPPATMWWFHSTPICKTIRPTSSPCSTSWTRVSMWCRAGVGGARMCWSRARSHRGSPTRSSRRRLACACTTTVARSRPTVASCCKVFTSTVRCTGSSPSTPPSLEGALSVVVIGVDGDEGLLHAATGAPDGVGRAPWLRAPRGCGEPRRKLVELLEHVVDRHLVFVLAAHPRAEVGFEIVADDEHDLGKPRGQRIVEGVVRDGLAARPEAIDLFEAAVPAAHSRSKDEEGWLHGFPCMSACRYRSPRCEQTEPPRDCVVVACIRPTGEPLIEVLKLRPFNGHGLIVASADHFSVTDVIAPRRAVERDILLADERRGSAFVQGRPGTFKTLRRPRAEVAAVVRASVESFDEGQVLVRSVHPVDIAGFEQAARFRVLHHDDGIAESVWELRDGRLALVPATFVIGKEEMAGLRVADHPEIQPPTVLFDNRWGLGEEGRGHGPLRRIARVVRRREHGGPRLEDEIPFLLRREVEQLWRGDVGVEAGRFVHVVEGSLGRLPPIGKGQVDHAVDSTASNGACVDVPAIIVPDYGWVLDGNELVGSVGYGGDDGRGRSPREADRQSPCRPRRWRRRHRRRSRIGGRGGALRGRPQTRGKHRAQ